MIYCQSQNQSVDFNPVRPSLQLGQSQKVIQVLSKRKAFSLAENNSVFLLYWQLVVILLIWGRLGKKKKEAVKHNETAPPLGPTLKYKPANRDHIIIILKRIYCPH